MGMRRRLLFGNDERGAKQVCRISSLSGKFEWEFGVSRARETLGFLRNPVLPRGCSPPRTSDTAHSTLDPADERGAAHCRATLGCRLTVSG